MNTLPSNPPRIFTRALLPYVGGQVLWIFNQPEEPSIFCGEITSGVIIDNTDYSQKVVLDLKWSAVVEDDRRVHQDMGPGENGPWEFNVTNFIWGPHRELYLFEGETDIRVLYLPDTPWISPDKIIWNPQPPPTTE